MKNLYHANQICRNRMIRFGKVHPYAASVLYLLDVPVTMLAGITAVTAVVSAPMAMICGWL